MKRAVLLGAGRGVRRLDVTKSYPAALELVADDRTALDWNLATIRGAGIREIAFIGGYHIEKIIERHSDVAFFFDHDWHLHGPLASLLLATQWVEDGVLLLDADVVLTDNRKGVETGVAHLVARGHRSIGFLGDGARIATARQRHEGYVDALTAAGISVSDQHVVRDAMTVEIAQRSTEDMLTSANPPTALFTAQNLITIGALKALRRLGLQQQVALVGFDDFLLADLMDPPVSVVAQDPHTIGRWAAEQLFRRSDGDSSVYKTQVMPSRLIARGSGEIPPRR